jgi:hypothetical protein
VGDQYRLVLYEHGQMNNPVPERIHPRPPCSIQDGYELYRRQSRDLTKTYESQFTSIQLFFQSFNAQFPDVTLTISQERPSTGIFETECCPIYTISW